MYFIWSYNVSKGWSLKCRPVFPSNQSKVTQESKDMYVLFLDVTQDLNWLVHGPEQVLSIHGMDIELKRECNELKKYQLW